MPDTARGNFKDEKCSDCGEIGCAFQHWGDLVPAGEFGSFCVFCWQERIEDRDRGKTPKPLGVQPPGIPQEFLGGKIRVFTKSGSVYELVPTGIDNERVVSCDRRKLHFSVARAMRLEVGKSLWLKPRDGGVSDLWYTSPVVRIEQ